MGKRGEIVICPLLYFKLVSGCGLWWSSNRGHKQVGWGRKRAISLEKQHKWRELPQPGDAQGVPGQATPGKIPTKSVAPKQDPAHTERFVSFSDH